MWEVLFWLYLINVVFLITHEIDSAYWKEWELFGLPGGINNFLIVHLPLLFLIIYGIVLVQAHSFIGLIFSLLLALGGMFAFIIHMVFIKQGRPEFKTPLSLFILAVTLSVSLIQLTITINLLSGRYIL